MNNNEIYIQIDFNNDYGMKEFLESFMINFKEESLRFFDMWGFFPFTYREKQVTSAIAPAIHKLTGNVWLEQPFKTQKGEIQRFLDIATLHDDNIYLIELKHSWNSKSESVAQFAEVEWETSIKQIADLNITHVREFVNIEEFNVYKIALMVMPTYLKNDADNPICNMSAKDYSKLVFDDFMSYTNKEFRANYVSTWKIQNPKEYEHEYEDNIQIFPFVNFVVKIEPIKLLGKNK